MTTDYVRDCETADRATEQLALAVLELSALEALHPRNVPIEHARNKAIQALEFARYALEMMRAND